MIDKGRNDLRRRVVETAVNELLKFREKLGGHDPVSMTDSAFIAARFSVLYELIKGDAYLEHEYKRLATANRFDIMLTPSGEPAMKEQMYNLTLKSYEKYNPMQRGNDNE